jgi:hypothetical protein
MSAARKVRRSRRETHAGQGLHERGVQRLEPDGSPVRSKIRLVDVLEALLLERLHRVGLDHRVAAQRFGQQGSHLPDPLPRGGRGAAQPPRVVHDRQQHQRRQDEDEQSEPRVEREDVDQEQEKRQESLDQVRQVVAERVLDLLDVGEHPAHQVAGGASGVEAGGLVEQPPVGVPPQVAHHRDADPVQLEFREVGEEVLREQREEEQERDGEAHRDPPGLGGPAGGRVPGVQPPQEQAALGGGRPAKPAEGLRGARAKRVVEDSSDEVEHGDGRQGDDRHRADGRQGPDAVPREVTEQAAKGLHRAPRRTSERLKPGTLKHSGPKD